MEAQYRKIGTKGTHRKKNSWESSELLWTFTSQMFTWALKFLTLQLFFRMLSWSFTSHWIPFSLCDWNITTCVWLYLCVVIIRSFASVKVTHWGCLLVFVKAQRISSTGLMSVTAPTAWQTVSLVGMDVISLYPSINILFAVGNYVEIIPEKR